MERTRLRYVNLPGVLSDGKVDRAGKVNGFVLLFMGQRQGWIFLREGEAVLAALLRPERRDLVPVEWLVSLAEREQERGDVAYYGAQEEQLRAMYATLAPTPVVRPTDVEQAQPELLFRRLADTHFDGVVEVQVDGGVNYLVLGSGELRSMYLAGGEAAGSGPASLDALLLDAAGRPEIRGFAAVETLPVQAPVALARLYLRVIEAVLADVAASVETEPAVTCFQEALVRQRREYPELAQVKLDPDGHAEGVVFGTQERVTQATASWLFEALTLAGRNWELDASETVARAALPHRHALEAQGFLRCLPWPIPW